MQLRPTIHGLRTAGGKDAAILDLLHLLELHEPPVQLRVDYLQGLWQCSQPQVSRRIAAINELGYCRAENLWGSYRLSIEPLASAPERSSLLQTSRQRWAALQQQWKEVQS